MRRQQVRIDVAGRLAVAAGGHQQQDVMLEKLNENLLEIATLWLFLMATIKIYTYLPDYPELRVVHGRFEWGALIRSLREVWPALLGLTPSQMTALVGGLQAVIDRNAVAVAKPDIWTPRQFAIPATAKATEVGVGIWDSGVDLALFKAAPARGMAFAEDGTPWFIDWNNHLVRKVTKDGTVRSVVGWTDPVFPGDGNVEDPTAEWTVEEAQPVKPDAQIGDEILEPAELPRGARPLVPDRHVGRLPRATA